MVDTSSITMTERRLVPIQFLHYKDKIWCDVIPMDVGHIIFDRPLLFDLDVMIYDRSNSCSFNFKGKKIQPPRPNNKSKKKEATKEKGLNIISPREFFFFFYK
jgi:hypothetical protein